MSDEEARVLFISHLHEDKPIADIVREFVENEVAPGQIKVYQSSDSRNAPRVGKRLNEELRSQLAEAGVVVWIYPSATHDWTYCMWECTIATETQPEANLVLLQFSEDYPAPFQELVRVNALDQTSIRTVVNNLFTQPDFFSGFDRPLAPGWQPNDKRILERADTLFATLQGVLPGGIDSWPAWAYFVLQFQADKVLRVKEEEEEKRVGLVKDLLTSTAVIMEGDKTAQGLFGRARFPAGLPFSEVLQDWQNAYPGADDRWVTSLARQIGLAARGSYPLSDWVVMRGATRAGEWCIPVITWVRTMPSKDMQFDVYFIPVREVDEASGSLDLGVEVPRSAE